jgi:C1A family cysteine protease
MRTAIKTTILIALAATAAFAFMKINNHIETVDPVMHKTFNLFAQKFNKSYATPKEFIYRLSVFAKNYKEMKEVQAVATHKVGITQFFDLTREEFLTKYTGLNFVKSPKNFKELPVVNQSNVAFDWRTKGAVNPVKNQGQCGSCWAFSAITSLESAWKIAGNNLENFSEQQLVDCSGSQGNQGCNGGWMDYAFTYIKVNGIEKTSDYPYTARDGTCKADKTKYVAKIINYVDVPANTGSQLLAAAQIKPVSIAVDANAFFAYTSGILSTTCTTSLNHGVAVVGYGQEGATNFWIIRNSWGATWGEQGYVRIADDGKDGSKGYCGVNMVPSYPDKVSAY